MGKKEGKSIGVNCTIMGEFATLSSLTISLGTFEAELRIPPLARYTSLGSTHNTFPNPLLRRTPSSTPLSTPSPSTPTSGAQIVDLSQTQSTEVTDGVGGWLPAWELTDESQERAGREVSLGQVEERTKGIREERSRDRGEVNGKKENGKERIDGEK